MERGENDSREQFRLGEGPRVFETASAVRGQAVRFGSQPQSKRNYKNVRRRNGKMVRRQTEKTACRGRELEAYTTRRGTSRKGMERSGNDPREQLRLGEGARVFEVASAVIEGRREIESVPQPAREDEKLKLKRMTDVRWENK